MTHNENQAELFDDAGVGKQVDPNRMFDFGSPYAETYTEFCKCGRKTQVSGEPNDGAVILIELYVKCECGASIEFKLPGS